LSEWVWTFDLCSSPQCVGKKVKVTYDDGEQVRKCPSCGEVTRFGRYEWRKVQSIRRIVYGYMPGKPFFMGKSADEIFRMYWRVLPKDEWLSWVGHDYAVAKLRFNPILKENLIKALNLLVEKMRYSRSEVEEYIARLESGREGLLHAPKTTVKAAVKTLIDEWVCLGEKDALKTLLTSIPNYQFALLDLYRYHRRIGDLAGCWCTGEVLKALYKMYDGSEMPHVGIKYDKLVYLDFERDVLAGVRRTYNMHLRTMEWHLMQAYIYLRDGDAVPCIKSCMDALAALHDFETVYQPNYAAKMVLEKIGDEKLRALLERLAPPGENWDIAEVAELFVRTCDVIAGATGRRFPLEGDDV
jgi:uncharacterized C2H2 Zn-finger protein